jgi:PBP1b-binding outer membrane lipoprotein LpoB
MKQAAKNVLIFIVLLAGCVNKQPEKPAPAATTRHGN